MRFISLFSILILVGFSAFAEVSTVQPSCHIRTLIQHYSSPSTTTQGPRVRSNAEMMQILNRTRDFLISDIRGGKPVSELHPSQQLMIRRLESIDRLIFKDCPDLRPTNPGASYKLLMNSIEVCQQTKSAPEIALISVFGHELGHSIDMVNLGCRVLKVTARGLSIPAVRTTTSTQAAQEIVMSSSQDPFLRPLDPESWAKDLEQIRDSRGRTFNECAFKTKAEKEALDALIRSGRIEVVDSGVPVLSHPQRSTFACLKNASRSSEPPTSQAQAERGGYFEYGEKSAQIWGARAVARYVASTPTLTPQDALGIAQFSPIYEKKVDEKETDLDSIYLSEPALQRTFRCQPTEVQNCLSYFRPDMVPGNNAQPTTRPTNAQPKQSVR